jgi:hypothetical protein
MPDQDEMRFGVHVLEPLPIFRAESGDRLIVRIGHPEPLILMRTLPANYAAITKALCAGTAVPLNPMRPTYELIRLLSETQGLLVAGAAPEPQRRKYGRLELVKGGAT